MSHLQFHFTCVLVLTLSWLNLRYKNMNTDRIKEVTALVFSRPRRAALPRICLTPARRCAFSDHHCPREVRISFRVHFA